MLPTAAISYDMDLLLRSCAFDLLRATGSASATPGHRRMTLALPWRQVAGSLIDTGVQRFVSFRRDTGSRVDLHSATGLGSGALPAGRPIASITMGAARVAVHADVSLHGFQATWTDGETQWRLAGEAISLLDFMDLLSSLDWPN